MNEMKIELISDRCKDCPRLKLGTVILGMERVHRCEHLQFCREVLGFWKAGQKINELRIDFVSEEDLERMKKIRPSEVMAPQLHFGDE